jgi:hypothetical protein
VFKFYVAPIILSRNLNFHQSILLPSITPTPEKINLWLGGGRSKSSRGPDPARGPPVGHRWSRRCGSVDISQLYGISRPLLDTLSLPILSIFFSFWIYTLPFCPFQDAVQKVHITFVTYVHLFIYPQIITIKRQEWLWLDSACRQTLNDDMTLRFRFSLILFSVVSWSEFLATDSDTPGSIPGATRFSEK